MLLWMLLVGVRALVFEMCQVHALSFLDNYPTVEQLFLFCVICISERY